LPERRVDVFSELVELLLGLWEVYKAEREGVSDVRELVLADGTGRKFMDEKDAVEAKRRALTYIADWMQRNQLADVAQTVALEQLERFFHEREGATDTEKRTWAENFLVIAHERSGLFIEAQPGIHAFSHGSFREYLAATALIEDLDPAMVRTVLDHADDSWWEEVILLAAAHPMLSSKRREFLLQQMLDAGHVTLVGRCAVDAGARLPAPMRERIIGLLHERMTQAQLEPKERYAAGEALDELGWLPEDLNAWLPCPKCADGGGDLLAMRYPVTNAQFERFIIAGGYDEPAYWGGPEGNGWQWRESPPNYRGEGSVKEPEYWRQARFGKERRGYPVVGVSWYEAAAYASWLTDVLGRVRTGDAGLPDEDRALVADLLERGVAEIRLPQEDEWRRMAGGTVTKDRYPWDAPKGPVTKEEAVILARCNVRESGIGGTSPAGMYPLGESQPHKLMDLGGNVWEWTDSWYDEEKTVRVLVGGSWGNDTGDARCASRFGLGPDYSNLGFGFRLVSPIVPGS
jgi:formylglycine-generating enzyme required for sulfatase activity